MQISDLTVEVRDSSLARVGQILPADLVGFEASLRFNKVGSWKIALRSDHPLVDTLRAPGSGIIVTGPTGVLLSGPTASAKNTKTAADPTGVWEIVGTDDGVILGERLAYPVPASASLASQTVAYDVRTGKAETVAKAYVDANIGPSAPAARKISALTIDTDLARGSTVVASARFDKLGQIISSLLVLDGLGFDIKQSGSTLVFEVFAPVDRSDSIRMDVDNLRLEKSEYTYQRPEATRVIVAGQGQGGERAFVERSSAASTSAESAWGRRIEVFKDSRNTADTAELQIAGDEILAAGGKTLEGIKVTPSDNQTMRYGVDWGLGDKVTVVIGSTQVAQVVTEVAIVVTENGIKIGATVGEPGVLEDYEAGLLSASTDQSARITALEVNESTGGINASSITTGTLDANRLPIIPASRIADGSLSNAKLTNSSIQWNESAVALGDTLAVPVSQNFLINGGFDVWQRGTSFVNSGATAYVADRWNNANNALGTHTITRQTNGAPVGSRYCIRTATTAATSYASKAQLIETNNVYPLLGKTVIFSVKLRRNSSFNSNLAIQILKSSTVDAAINGTFSSLASSTVANESLPTGTSSSDWFIASVTATIPSDGTANTLQVRVRETIAQGNGAYWEMAEAQLEIGSVATPFRRNALTIQAELAACQRYYARFDAASAGRFGLAGASSTTQAFITVPLPVSMRAMNSVAYSNMSLTTFSGSAAGAISAIVAAESSGASLGSLNITASSLTANSAYFLRASSAGFLAFDGEL
jgi:hypothetical protein